MKGLLWLIRVSGFALCVVSALLSPAGSGTQREAQAACFALAVAALVAWTVADLRPAFRPKGLPAILTVTAVAGGVAGATSGGGQSLIAFACAAASVAGFEFGQRGTAGVAIAGIVPLWVSVAVAGGGGPGTVVGYPLLIVGGAVFGANRRSYRVQAEQAAALLAQRERLADEERRADVLDERNRIAREIHDVLAHSLGALGIQIQAAKAILTDHGDTERAVEALTVAQRMAADGLTETRRAVHALRVDTLPLADEVAALAETHRQRYGTPVTVDVGGPARDLPPDGALALLRVAQESLLNAAKHAPGEPVTVRLGYGETGTRLTVSNPRPEVTAEAHEGGGSVTGGYGLTGMRERLLLQNGSLASGPRDNEWHVTAELPRGRVPGETPDPEATP